MRVGLLIGAYLVVSCVHEVVPNSFLRDLIFPRRPMATRVKTINEVRLNIDTVLHFVTLVSMHGYPAEEHTVTTKDGYRLLLHRIPGSPSSNSTGSKPVVYFLHPLLASSDLLVARGPGLDLSFELADAGYDVWLGNVRGNSYGRSHESLTTDDPEFWNFSYHEYAVLDVPATIDYILRATGYRHTDLYFIGHSLSTTVSYALLSALPEYNEKIRLVVSMSPIAYWRHELPPIQYAVFHTLPQFAETLANWQVYDVLPQSITLSFLVNMFCGDNTPTQTLCLDILSEIIGDSPAKVNATYRPYLLKYYPAGVSTKTLVHVSQNVVSGELRLFDYGPTGNLVRYNQREAPHYDLKKISAPVLVFHAKSDMFVKDPDVYELLRRLPNVAGLEIVPDKKFNHADFIIALNARAVVYDRLIELMRSH